MPERSPEQPLMSIEPGERLTRRAGVLAGRLADLLESALAGMEERKGAVRFLRTMAHETRDEAAEFLDYVGPAHPLDRLVRGYGLTSLEVNLLLLAGLPEEHEGYAGVLRGLHPRSEPRPTAGLAAQLLAGPAPERRHLSAVLESGAAVHAGVLRLGEDGPFFERSLLLADALWPALQGVDAWPASVPRREGQVLLAGLAPWLGTPACQRARAALLAGEDCTLLVTADGEELAYERAAALVHAAGLEPLRVQLPPRPAPELERLVSVHAVARGGVPVVRLGTLEGPGAPQAPGFEHHPGPVVVCGRTGGVLLDGGRRVIEVPAGALSATERQTMWQQLFPELKQEAASLAVRYTVEPDVAGAIVRDARELAALDERPPTPEDVGRSARARAGLSLSSGVRLVRPTARWEQLVLPAPRLAQLREGLDRLLNQARVLDEWGFLAGRPGARGVRMLFCGPSGTGKTLSAEILAAELGVDLLVVDISRVVSKWIGETEKNLAEVFDVAESARAVLLFDEADALFGKRTEVSDAHDRYANLETAYLLTRLERFEGLAILSTNLMQNVDPAFLRRIEFVLEFEEPGIDERKLLWACHFPPTAPLARDLDVRELALLYPIVGGLIRNAAVAAAFLAAADGSDIGRRHVIRAIRREYEKSGRAFPGAPAGMAASAEEAHGYA